MYKKRTSLLAASLIVGSSYVSAASFNPSPQAKDDHGSIIVGVTVSMEGNVASNDQYGGSIDFSGSMAGQYGFLEKVNTSGAYTYKLYDNVTSSTIPVGETVFDIFPYTNTNSSNRSSSANLIIDLSVVDIPKPEINSNVDVEFNDRSWQATPLNSGRNILGHLHNGGDKDWFSLASTGDETISLELCPQGSSCFGQKSWVMYVFDSAKLTTAIETENFVFNRWLNDTGSSVDESGRAIINGSSGSSNHMYLAYRTGAFDAALIGVIDPCFGSTNSVNLGVGNGPRNYYIAVSSPLRGDGDAGDEGCGNGSVVLRRPGLAASGSDAEGKAKKYDTTEEYISIFPNSDDQYSITVTGTGVHPLLSDEAIAKSATFDVNTGELAIPKVRISDEFFTAKLKLKNTGARSSNGSWKFALSDFNAINIADVADFFQATYVHEELRVHIPRVTDKKTGIPYSVILQYYPERNGNDAWLELYSVNEIK